MDLLRRRRIRGRTLNSRSIGLAVLSLLIGLGLSYASYKHAQKLKANADWMATAKVVDGVSIGDVRPGRPVQMTGQLPQGEGYVIFQRDEEMERKVAKTRDVNCRSVKNGKSSTRTCDKQTYYVEEEYWVTTEVQKPAFSLSDAGRNVAVVGNEYHIATQSTYDPSDDDIRWTGFLGGETVTVLGVWNGNSIEAEVVCQATPGTCMTPAMQGHMGGYLIAVVLAILGIVGAGMALMYRG